MDFRAAREPTPVTPEAGDFAALLRQRGLYPPSPAVAAAPVGAAPLAQTQATTILAFKFADGVLVAGALVIAVGATSFSIALGTWRPLIAF